MQRIFKFSQHIRFSMISPVRVSQITIATVIIVPYLVWSWSNFVSDFVVDSAMYLLMAQHWSPWASSSEVAEYYTKRSLFPPLFPAVLAIFNAGNKVLLAHLVTTGFFFAWLAVLYVWCRNVKIDRWATTAIILAVAFLPGSYLQVLKIHSENAYLFFSLFALVAIGRAELEKSANWYLVAALLISVTTLTRGAGVALIAAFLLHLIIHRPRNFWVLALISIIPFAVWLLVRSGHSNNYTAILSENMISMSSESIIAKLRYKAQAVYEGYLLNFGHNKSSLVLAQILGIFGIAGAIYRAHMGKIDGYYVLIYLALILIWGYPAQSQRFVYGILPLMLLQGILVIRFFSSIITLPGRLPAAAPWIYIIAILAMSLPNIAFDATRFYKLSKQVGIAHARLPVAYESALETDALQAILYYQIMRAGMKRIAETVPKDDCIFSTIPTVVSYYSNRKSLLPPGHKVDNLNFDKIINELGCNYVLMAIIRTPSFPNALYPGKRMGHELLVHWSYNIKEPTNTQVIILAERVSSK